MISVQYDERRGGESPASALARVGASTVPNIGSNSTAPRFVVRYALDPAGCDQHGRRLCLDDMPAGGAAHVDMSGCVYPVAEAAREIRRAERRGVLVTFVFDSPASARAWGYMLERVA